MVMSCYRRRKCSSLLVVYKFKLPALTDGWMQSDCHSTVNICRTFSECSPPVTSSPPPTWQTAQDGSRRDGTTVWWTVQWCEVMYHVEKWQKYFEPFLCFVLVMQTALCPPAPQSVLETAISHAYPEQGRDNVALYCLSVHPHSLWGGGKTRMPCCHSPDSWTTKFSAKPHCQIYL